MGAVPERSKIVSEGSKLSSKVRLSRLAAKQFGLVRWEQIVRIGVSRATIFKWAEDGYLDPIVPGIYAVGHQAPTVESQLSQALLYAGDGAMLSHVTALWWLGLVDRRPSTIHLSTPLRRRSCPGMKVHSERSIDRIFHNGLPITPVGQALLDYSASAPLKDVRYVLAEAEYHELLDLDAVRGTLGRGRPGSAKLRTALERHEPRLARTRSECERKLVSLCEAGDIPLPEVNAPIGRMTVDAVWWEQRVVVEVDGAGGHTSRAQMVRDRRRELRLRALGFTVIRYTWDQLENEPELVLGDLRVALRLVA
jgi:very-short-patch-repair endonuclease